MTYAMPQWLASNCGRGREPTCDELLALCGGIHDLMDAGNLREIDAALQHANPREMAPITMCAMLRYPFLVRDRLPHWQPFLERVRVELERRGENVADLLKGLIVREEPER